MNDYPDYSKSEVQNWVSDQGVNVLQALGIQRDQIILDFGCGVGNYSIPAAKIVGTNGKVFALDKENEYDPISHLLSRVNFHVVQKIIQPIRTHGELKIGLANETVDVIFLFDVLHLIIKNDMLQKLDSFKKLLLEINRVIRESGKLFLTIHHLDEISFSLEEILSEINNMFSFQSKEVVEMLHWDFMREETVYIYKKKELNK